jgi:N-acetylglutamate synthase-like GNAT family acetyltransferase
MTPISRGFRGHRPVNSARVPPGQHVVEEFPVLSVGSTPHTPLEQWTFQLSGAVDQPLSWTWEELLALPAETPTVDIHCVTAWSKLATTWRGVSVDTLLEVREPDGTRHSFVDLDELSAIVALNAPGETPQRAELLRETLAALRDGVPAVNLCASEGLANELFTYAGSGTLFTRERYVDVRALGIDDFDAADDLIARGVAEGYLAPRSPEQLDRVFACGVGAFVEGRHLAGIGALLPYPDEHAGEIASLYTLTRFLGEGIGSHLIAALCERAKQQACEFVFACTTTERVAGFFERHGFRRVSFEDVPAAKWQDYDRRRRPRVRCLRRDLAAG